MVKTIDAVEEVVTTGGNESWKRTKVKHQWQKETGFIEADLFEGLDVRSPINQPQVFQDYLYVGDTKGELVFGTPYTVVSIHKEKMGARTPTAFVTTEKKLAQMDAAACPGVSLSRFWDAFIAI